MIFKIKKKLNFFDKCVLIFNCILSITLLISYMAPVVDPAKFWMVAILGLAYPSLLILSSILMAYWLFRNRVFALISVFTILAGIKILAANFSFHQFKNVPGQPHAQNIKIMAYNVHGFGGFEDKSSAQIQSGIIDLINSEQPDIINMEEFFEDHDTRETIFSSLKKIMKTNYYYFQPYDYTKWDSTGIAIFSRYPIIARGAIHAADTTIQTQAIFADVKKGDSIFRVYCFHLQSTHFEPSEHEYIRNLVHHGKFNFRESKIIGNKLKNAFIKRSYQVAAIKENMARCPYPYIVGGDFNDTPNSFAVNQISKGLKNAFAERGSGMGITYYGDFPNSQIDYILTSQGFKINNYQVIKAKLSDHYPIVSNISLMNDH